MCGEKANPAHFNFSHSQWSALPFKYKMYTVSSNRPTIYVDLYRIRTYEIITLKHTLKRICILLIWYSSPDNIKDLFIYTHVL